MDDEDSKSGLKFWIAALAFSTLMLATTFALLATYLAEIKSNTEIAITRSDMVADRLNNLDTELTVLHRQMVEQKESAAKPGTVTVAAPPPQGPAMAVPAVPVPEGTAAAPAIQAPAMKGPEPAVPPASSPAPAKP